MNEFPVGIVVRFFVVHFQSAYRFGQQSRIANSYEEATLSDLFLAKVNFRTLRKRKSDLPSAVVSSDQREVRSDVLSDRSSGRSVKTASNSAACAYPSQRILVSPGPKL